MDQIAQRFDASEDGDLMITRRGIAYQRNMNNRKRVSYGAAYMAKVDAYDGTQIGRAVNAGRLAMLRKHIAPGATVLDYGAGSGAFVRDAVANGFSARGYDVMPDTKARLQSQGLWANDVTQPVDAWCMWDVIEHFDSPGEIFRLVRKGTYLFVSIPIFPSFDVIRASKHYRPNEHLHYFTGQGFIDWMALYFFRLLDESAHEVEAGRDSIGAFAFRKDLPDYHDHLAAYKEMHATRHYGSSATEMHLQAIADIVRHIRPNSILDYGCGRSDLAAHFWLDGGRRIVRYDPAIPAFASMDKEQFDLVLCCDVLEHIPMACVDRVLSECRSRGKRAVFTISMKPSRAKLPDGRNAHVTLLNADEWTRWIENYYGKVRRIKTAWPHEIMLAAGEL